MHFTKEWKLKAADSMINLIAIGGCYTAFGLCCGRRYLTKAREDYGERLAERKRIF